MHRFILALALLLAAQSAMAFDTAYWVWHRDTPLRPAEVESLQRQSVLALYWHVGTLHPEGDAWRVEGQLRFPSKQPTPFAIAPVLRLSAEGRPVFTEAAAASAARVLAEALRQTGAHEAQLDYDCPDRRLAEYARFVAECRARIAPAKLSVTALAGWSRLAAFPQIQASADRLLPMFYDLAPDAPADMRAGKALPILDLARFEQQLVSWRGCKTPWLAGLPNFARVTTFDAAGRSRGHLRAWSWDSICFNPALIPAPSPAPGVALFRTETETRIDDTGLAAGDSVACRWPDAAQLARAIATAKTSGAAGVAIFRLPGAGPQSGWCLGQMETLLRDANPGAPALRLRLRAQALELANVSASDLPPRLQGPNGAHDRGWPLELESTAGSVFREAGAGEFAQVFAHADPDAADPQRVAVPLAQRLTFWFADLPAGRSRQGGLLQLAPGADPSTLRWRIPGSPQNSTWQSLE
jgi:hypothetical protein